MRYKILITGGPVHANLDAVKIITNKFKGGLMADLADQFGQRNTEVTYLTTKGSKLPASGEVKVLFHTGFHDYMKQVLELAPHFDVVILGGAVSNLIPVNPWEGKFPSHNYKPEDVINIPFMIAPRVIDKVKEVAPNCTLIGFKLLSGVEHDELIHAAYGTLLDSKATAVIANDATNLQTKYVVTKERGVHELSHSTLCNFLMETVIGQEHYKTQFVEAEDEVSFVAAQRKQLRSLMDQWLVNHSEEFQPCPEGLAFGTFAARLHDGFLTTARGKTEFEKIVRVLDVDHGDLIVHVEGETKATLNAPLLAHIFTVHPDVEYIVHSHTLKADLPNLPYAMPGTVADSLRGIPGSFNIEGHGSFLLLDASHKVLY